MTLSSLAPASSRPAAPSPVALARSSDVSHVGRRIAAGEYVRVRRGVVAPAAAWNALKPWERYTARVHAVAMTHPDVVFSHESAAVLWGLPVFGDPIVVHVLHAAEATSRLHGGIRTHTTSGDREIVELGGVLVTDRSDVVVDLARTRHAAVGLAVADAALRADPALAVGSLLGVNEARPGSRGRRIARWPLQRATPLAETALESVSRAVIEWLGFEGPSLQVEFETDGVVDRVDMWWQGARAVGESDGDVKYDGSLGAPQGRIRAEKARDRRLRWHADAIAHWGWADAARGRPLGDALRHAGLTQVRLEDSRQLHSLRDLLLPRASAHPTPRAAAARTPLAAAARTPLPQARETAQARRDRG